MPSREHYIKKIYADMVSLIADLFFKQRLTYQEMNFLLNLVEEIFIKQQRPELLELLSEWIIQYEESEIDGIIKATLLAMDFNDEESMQENMKIVEGLMAGE